MNGKAFTADEQAVIREYYKKVDAREIAKLLDRSLTSVYQTARRMGLATATHRFTDADAKRLIEMAAAGHCNRCIGRELKFERHEIARWRAKLGARPLTVKAMPSSCTTCIAKVRANTARQCQEAGVESLGQVRALAIRQYAIDNGWPADLRARAVQILNVLRDHGPQTRRQLAERIGVPWKGSRKSLVSNDPEGSYLAHLQARGLVVRLGRIVKGSSVGKSVNLYSLVLNWEEVVREQIEAAGTAEQADQ